MAKTEHIHQKNGGTALKQQFYDQLKDLVHELEQEKQTHVNWKLLSDKSIKNIIENPFFDIGSHSFAQIELGTVDKEMAQNDLRMSKIYLDELLNQNTDIVAFPSGSYVQETKTLAKQVGLKNNSRWIC